MAIQRNITIDQHTTWQKVFTLYDVNHLPFDLTNFTPSAQIKKSHGTSNVASFICNKISPANNGQLLLTLEYNSLSNTAPGIYSYDVLLSSANTKIRAVEGTVNIVGNITT